MTQQVTLTGDEADEVAVRMFANPDVAGESVLEGETARSRTEWTTGYGPSFERSEVPVTLQVGRVDPDEDTVELREACRDSEGAVGWEHVETVDAADLDRCGECGTLTWYDDETRVCDGCAADCAVAAAFEDVTMNPDYWKGATLDE